MIYWALVFLIVAIVAGALGLTGVADSVCRGPDPRDHFLYQGTPPADVGPRA